jgi:hypothetical protein
MVDKDNAITCVRSRGRDAPVPADSRLSPTQASASAPGRARAPVARLGCDPGRVPQAKPRAQFEGTYWARAEGWDRHDAAVHGSSHYCLPGVLRWFTANIGIHHVHHLCSGMPFYRLPQVLRDHPELGAVGRLTLSESLRCVRLVLWDEGRRRLISFRDLRRRAV